LTHEQIRVFGLQELAKINPKTKAASRLKTWLTDYQFNQEYPDDRYIWLTDVLALRAVDLGNFGVGSILTDDNGNVIFQGHNELFNPYFRSDRHAEMVVMDKFEETHRKITKLEDYTLYTSLEPCPMCLVRLITSNVSTVLHAAPDMTGGMVHEIKHLLPFWNYLAEGKVFAQAMCCPELINAANEIFSLNVDELIEKLKNR
jgi:tRNA(Arg) A34 adenosine deaminase TadA